MTLMDSIKLAAKEFIDILPGLKARGFLEYKYARHLQS